MAELRSDINEGDYHADPCAQPSLSASIANVLIEKSPLHAWMRHPKLGGVASIPTKTMDRGTLAHALVLGAGPEIEIVDAKDWRTKAAKEQREAAREAGKLATLAREYEDAVEVADQWKARLADLQIELSGASEVTALWDEESTLGPVKCRGRLDHVLPQTGVIYDMKTTASAHPKDVGKSIARYGYAIQRAAYVSALSRIRPELEGRIDYVWLFCETEPPYCVTPARASGTVRLVGETMWRRAVETWARCLKTKAWPAYVDEIVDVDMPAWAYADEMAEAV